MIAAADACARQPLASVSARIRAGLIPDLRQAHHESQQRDQQASQREYHDGHEDVGSRSIARRSLGWCGRCRQQDGRTRSLGHHALQYKCVKKLPSRKSSLRQRGFNAACNFLLHGSDRSAASPTGRSALTEQYDRPLIILLFHCRAAWPRKIGAPAGELVAPPSTNNSCP